MRGGSSNTICTSAGLILLKSSEYRIKYISSSSIFHVLLLLLRPGSLTNLRSFAALGRLKNDHLTDKLTMNWGEESHINYVTAWIDLQRNVLTRLQRLSASWCRRERGDLSLLQFINVGIVFLCLTLFLLEIKNIKSLKIRAKQRHRNKFNIWYQKPVPLLPS